MAKLSAAKFTNRDVLVTGTDPSTGEYLSAAQRKALFRKQKISSNQVFRKPGALVKVDSIAPIKKESAIVPTDKKIAAKPSVDLTILSVRVSVLEKQVSFLAKALDKEAELEKKQQKEKERKLLQQEESGRRSAKEKQLEKSLSKTLLAPVKAVGGVAKGLLGGLMELFGTLFAGWLTDKGWKAIKAYAEGDTAKLEEIKNNVLKALGVVGGIFLALNGGIGVVLGIVTGLIGKVTKLGFKLAKGLVNALNPFKPKPPVKPPDASSVKPPTGSPPPGGVTGTSFSPGQQRGAAPQGGGPQGKSTFELEQARKAQTQANMTKPEGPRGPMDRFRRFIRGNLAKFETSKKGRAIFKAINWMKTGPMGKAAGFLFNPFIKAFEWAGNLIKPQNLKSVGDKLSKFKGLGRIMGPLFALIDVGSRANKGMSPAQAIIPAILKALLTSGAGALGAAVPIPGLNIATSIMGGFAGAWLGDQLMAGIDGVWEKSWDKNLFQGFNDAIKGIGKSDPTGIINKIFPYDGILNPEKPEQTTEQKILKSTQQGGMYEGYDPKDLQWNVELDIPEVRLEAASKYTDSEGNPIKPKKEPASTPSITKPAAEEKPAQVSKPQTVKQTPGPVSAAGNTQIIYKKVASGGGAQMQQSLKTGSATDVPLIASSNPSNFYTMYSQMEYGVVI